MLMKKIFTIIGFFSIFGLYAQEQPKEEWGDLFDMSLEELLNVKVDVVDKNFYLYGYINSNVQKTYSFPTRSLDNKTIKTDDPLEWSPVHNFHIYGQGNLSRKISYLFNLATDSEMIEVRNAWGNFMVKDYLQIRIGKMYRKFGLYNERLDQIPTFIGIEPPEMLDPDHLFLPRTTSLMVHGALGDHNNQFSYALMTDNGENGPVKSLLPMGWDFRYKSQNKSIIIGFSGYTSSINNTKTTSPVAIGEGAPTGGILPWMAGDKYIVAGIFIEKKVGNLIIQSEFYNSNHDAIRDPESTLIVIRNANINATQRARFLGSNKGKSNDELTEDDIAINSKYNIQTGYVRLGYNIQTKAGQLVPYIFLDWMNYPETIQEKDFGGDNEAGLADDGKFVKPSLGVAYRPISNIAIKLDGSLHSQKFNGEQISYPEIRLDFSFAFSNSMLKDL